MQQRISPRLSAGLDVARASAACYVVLHHVAASKSVLFRFGQEAVLIFFLLSGFVIFANERHRALNPYGYYLRRLRRIYPLLVVAMIVSAIIAWDNGQLAQLFRPSQVVTTLLSLQDTSALKPGVIDDPFLGNSPLWSLSYEVAFYLLFPLVLKAWVKNPTVTTNIIGAVCILCYAAFALYPNHFALVGAYFLVWWCGAMAADRYLNGHRSFLSLAWPLLWLGVLCATSAAVVFVEGHKGIGVYPTLPLRHFFVALAMLVVLFGPIGRSLTTVAAVFVKPAAAVASISFGVYVLHYPLLITWKRASSGSGFLLALVVLIACSFFAEHVLYRVIPKAPKN